MSTSTESLFKPWSLRKRNAAGEEVEVLSLSTRIVMPPMTRSFSINGVPGPDVAAYYASRASHGVGLIVTEGVAIDHPAAVMDKNIPRFHGDDALQGWAEVVKAVHAAGGKIVPQLWHIGSARPKESAKLPNPEAPPVSPSGIFKPNEGRVGEVLGEEEIRRIVAAFASAAADARRLGFDGVQIHGAHGYLVDQFFWAGTNLRTDKYGGDLVGRTTFAVEVLRAVREAVGPDFPVILRFSQWKQQEYTARLAATPEEFAAFLKPLVDAGVDIFDCSTRRFWEPAFEGSALTLAGWTKKLTGLPTIAVGSVGLETDFLANFSTGKFDSSCADSSIIKAAEAIARDEFELIAVGRALLSDPAWARKVREARLSELVPFSRDALAKLLL